MLLSVDIRCLEIRKTPGVANVIGRAMLLSVVIGRAVLLSVVRVKQNAPGFLTVGGRVLSHLVELFSVVVACYFRRLGHSLGVGYVRGSLYFQGAFLVLVTHLPS